MHARLKTEFTEEEKNHNLMTWLIFGQHDLYLSGFVSRARLRSTVGSSSDYGSRGCLAT